MRGHTFLSHFRTAALCIAVLSVSHARAADLSGEVAVWFDDVLEELYVHGVDVIGDTTQPDSTVTEAFAPFSATVDSNGLVVGAVVRDEGYTGGLMMNIYTQTDTFSTNGWSWKWMVDPPAGWEQPGFDDSNWPLVVVQGGADSTPSMSRDSSCIAATDSCPLNNYISSGARFVWAPENLYFRSTFSIDSACSLKVWAGCNGTHIIYLDGEEIVRDTTPDHSTEGSFWATVGEHQLSVYASMTTSLSEGTGNALKCSVARTRQVITPILDWITLDTIDWDTTEAYQNIHTGDTTWKVHWVEQEGWQNPEFDDSEWIAASLVSDQIYPTGFPGTSVLLRVKTIWLPQTIAIRGTVGGANAVRGRSAQPGRHGVQISLNGTHAARLSLNTAATVSMELFGLDGRRIAVLLPRAQRVAGTYAAALPTTSTRLGILRVSIGNSTLTRMVELGDGTLSTR